MSLELQLGARVVCDGWLAWLRIGRRLLRVRPLQEHLQLSGCCSAVRLSKETWLRMADHCRQPTLRAHLSQASLYEPMPEAFGRLHHRYRGRRRRLHERVNLVQAAVCDASCLNGGRLLWGVELSNRTGSWGRNESDPRCVQQPGASWISEISSLNKQHVLRRVSARFLLHDFFCTV